MEFTSKAYFDFIEKGKIMGSRCKVCKNLSLPPRPVCNKCGSVELKWEELDGKGKVKAFSIINVPLSRLKDNCPYIVGVVELDAGPRVSGMILDVKNGKLSIGSKVVAKFVKEYEKTTLCFKIVEG
jgi:uncharacterized OB-fold protein